MEDGDDRDAASVLQATQPITNRLQYIKNFFPAFDGAGPFYLDIPLHVIGAEDRFAPLLSPLLIQDSVNTGSAADKGEVWIPLRHPMFVQAGAIEILELAVRCEANTGHGAFPGGAPAGMPELSLFELNTVTGALTEIGSPTLDTSATSGAYEAPHYINKTGLGELVTTEILHYARLKGEAGANAIAGFTFYAIRLRVGPA